MNDSDFIEEIARKWIELGGDSEGVAWNWKRLQEAVINIEYAQQSVQADATQQEPPRGMVWCNDEELPSGV
jgi:hypothetical protein